MTTNRRSLLRAIPIAALTGFAFRPAFAADVDPKDAQAVGLGYVTDATKADKAKFAKYAAGQECGNCQLFQGKPTDASAPCTLFAGKTVPAKAWCGAYVKKV